MKWLAALLVSIGFASSASALDITGLSVVTSGANPADFSSTAGNNHRQNRSATSIELSPSGPVPDLSGSSITFETLYTSLLTADREAAGGNFTYSMTSEYAITFTVDNPTGQTYQLDIDTLRVGSLTNFTDSTGDSTTSVGAVTGTLDSIVNAALALPAVAAFTSSGTGEATFSQSGTTLTITDNALSRTFTLEFAWSASATSNRDEGSVRMGLAGTLPSTSSDDYPGVGGRTQGDDGHFVDITVTMMPEPHSGALLALGLLGLGLRRRLTRR